MFALIIVGIGSVLNGVASMTTKKLSSLHRDKSLALVYQYISIILFAFILTMGYAIIMDQPFLPPLTLVQCGWIVLVGVIGYVGIYRLFRAFDHLSGGVALIVANLSTFFMYFINIWLIDASEGLSPIKMVLAVIFFIIISLLLVSEDDASHSKKITLNIGVVYALITAVCRAIYFSGNTYFIKSNWLTPPQSLMVTELCVGLSSFVFYFWKQGVKGLSRVVTSCTLRDLPWIIALGFFMMTMIFCYYYGYQHLPSSMVNFIKLFSIVVTAICCRLFLGDKLTKKEIILMIAALVVLVGFVWVG